MVAFFSGNAFALDIKAGPIWSHSHAIQACPQATKHYGGWNGQWRTIEWGKMSVCGTNEGSTSSNPYDIHAGAIWSNADANAKCHAATQYYGGWNGQWTTTVWGSMSVCGANEIVDTIYP
ncbi:hypothetical protein A9Q99_26895 [Gammaproteobacteria bacterium 45_16_T64]|nr:hypothetical protein A9Q99_26895 [Gammaproteobacteria bacterium 45_16_T64]